MNQYNMAHRAPTGLMGRLKRLVGLGDSRASNHAVRMPAAQPEQAVQAPARLRTPTPVFADFQATMPMPEQEQAPAAQPQVPTAKTVDAAERVHVVDLTARDGQKIGAMHFYLYHKAGRVRRTVRFVNATLAQAFDKASYYLADVKWDATHDGLEEIILDTAREALRLVKAATSAHYRKEAESGVPAARKVAQAARANAKPKQPQQPKPTRPEKAGPREQVAYAPPVVTGQANLPVQPPAQPSAETGSVKAPMVKGDVFAGTVHSLGMAKLATYSAYCIELNNKGVITPLYGAELARLANQHGLKLGEPVLITYMGKAKVAQPPGVPDKWKNLYSLVRPEGVGK